MESSNRSLVLKANTDIDTNLDAIVEALKYDIAYKYDIVVTPETVAETKKLMAQINKDKDTFKMDFKLHYNTIIEPLKKLDLKAKEIIEYYEQAREALKSQVEKYEEKRFDEIKNLCTDYIISKGYTIEQIDATSISSKLSSVSNGKLTTAAIAALDALIFTIENDKRNAEIEAKNKALEIEVKRLESEQAEKLRTAIAVEKAKAEAEAKHRLEMAHAEALARQKLIAEETDRIKAEAVQQASQPEPKLEIKKQSITYINSNGKTLTMAIESPDTVVVNDYGDIIIGHTVIEFWSDFNLIFKEVKND